MTSANTALLKRYTTAERLNHWLTAVTFIMLAFSGLALFHPSMFWFSQLFGGPVWTRILHPYLGVVMFFSFAGLALRFWPHNLLTRLDIEWLKRIKDVVSNREEGLPEVDRYNAGQKLLFWTMVAMIPMLLITGIVIWRPWFAGYFPVGVVRLAVLVHAISAFVMITGIIVHIYAAIWIKGTMGAMIKGMVTRRWASKHHPGWYKRQIRGDDH